MAKKSLSCKFRESVDRRLSQVASRRSLGNLRPWTKSGIVETALRELFQSNPQVDTAKTRNTRDRVSRKFDIEESVKRELQRRADAARIDNHISHYASFGGWIEEALSGWLRDNDPP